MIRDFFGSRATVETLEQMLRSERIPQTILLSGPEGVGKATLARRFAAAILASPEKIEQDDLSSAANLAYIADREKWPADKRNEDPLLFSTHSDFVTFPPDGPLRQLSIQQMRLLKELAQFKPLHGPRRVFLIDHLDRANEQAANSLLKTLEEPPDHLIIVMTAENPYDLLPTIRSRAVMLPVSRLAPEEMLAFLRTRGLSDAARRLHLASGCPGIAVALDLQAYDQRRASMLKLLEVGSGQAAFAEWAKHSEAIAAKKSEKLDALLGVLYLLLEDTLLLAHGVDEIRNDDIRRELKSLADRVNFQWLRAAVVKVDELLELVRRNIQKSIALDAFVMELRRRSAAAGRL